MATVGGFHVRGAADRSVAWPAVAELAYRWGAMPPGVEPGLEATHFFKRRRRGVERGRVLSAVRMDRETGE